VRHPAKIAPKASGITTKVKLCSKKVKKNKTLAYQLILYRGNIRYKDGGTRN